MKLLKNWDVKQFKISKYNMGEQEPKSRGKINMKKTKKKTIRYKRQEDVKLDDFGNLTTKTVVEKMTEKEHRKLFKETAI